MNLLDGWKSIAAWFGVSVRTVQRWELEAGLPIQRVMRAQREAIYADPAALSAWRNNRLRSDPPNHGGIVVVPLLCPDRPWLGEELSADLIHALTAHSQFRVFGRTSCFALARQGLTTTAILNTLGANLLIEGEITPADEVRIRLCGSHGESLWTRTFPHGASQLWRERGSLSSAILAALKLHVPSPNHFLPDKAPLHVEGWLRARALFLEMQPASVHQAIQQTQSMLERDPDFAPLHADLGCYFSQSAVLGLTAPAQVITSSNQALHRALTLDPDLPEALIWRARNLALFEHNWQAADEVYTRLSLLAPHHPHLDYFYAADYLRCIGRHAEALSRLDRALLRDPFNALIRMGRVQVLAAMGRDADASAELIEISRLSEINWMALWLEGALFLRAGRQEAAYAVLARMQQAAPPFCWAVVTYACACLVTGQSAIVERLLEQALAFRESAWVPPSTIAGLHVVLGEDDLALEWFARAVSERDAAFTFQPRASFGMVLTPTLDARIRRRRGWAAIESNLRLPA
jgi:TolB-like protein